MLTGIYVFEDTKVTIQTGEGGDLVQLVVSGSSITESTVVSIPRNGLRELLLARGVYKITSTLPPAIQGDKIRTFRGKDPDPDPTLDMIQPGLTKEGLNTFFHGSPDVKGGIREP